GKDRATPGRELHTSFRLAAEGEYLALIRPDGVVAFEYSPAYPPQRSGYSYGADAAGEPRYFDRPTPRASNATSEIRGIVSPVRADAPSGLFDSPFDLTLTCDQAGATIRFTLDGSDPSRSAS